MDTILTLTEYSEHIGVPEEDIKGGSRKYQYRIPRQLYWLYLNTKGGLSKREIARIFNMDHTSIINGIKTVSDLIETEDKILSDYKDFISTFLHQQECN